MPRRFLPQIAAGALCVLFASGNLIGETIGSAADPLEGIDTAYQKKTGVTHYHPWFDRWPPANIDIYPMEYPDWGTLERASDQARESFSPGKALGNPQAYQKTGVDEIIAEGFSTSAVFDAHDADSKGLWNNGEWVVVIARPLKREGGSALTVGKDAFIGFAVWQGGAGEVGARKSVTMMWTPLKLVQGHQ